MHLTGFETLVMILALGSRDAADPLASVLAVPGE